MTNPLRIVLIALLALAGVAAIWAAFQIDEPAREAIVAQQGKKWKKSPDYQFYGAVRKFGDWPELMLAGGIGLFVAWRMKNRTWLRILAAGMIASTLAGVLANTSRLTTGRTRPNAENVAQGFYGPWEKGATTVGMPKYNSFPSGHTATAFGFAGVIAFANPWFGIGAVLLAGLIAWSSIYIGAHHPSDVVTSIILSLLVAWFTWQWVQRHGDEAWRNVRKEVRRRFQRKSSK